MTREGLTVSSQRQSRRLPLARGRETTPPADGPALANPPADSRRSSFMRTNAIVLAGLLAPGLATAAPPGTGVSHIQQGQADAAVTSTAPAVATAAPGGFYRDERGRIMQTSFDLQQRLWLGAAYAPRRRSG